MSDAAPRPPRRGLRWTAAVAGAGLLLAGGVALLLPRWLDAERVAGLVLAQADAATGLQWTIDGEPRLRWRPDLGLTLPRLRATDAAGRVVLTAASVAVVVPWSTLRGGEMRLHRLHVEAPVLDLDAAIQAWDALPDTGTVAFPEITGFSLELGTVHWAGGSADGLDVAVSSFAAGRPFDLRVSTRIALSAEAAPAPFRMTLRLRGERRDAPLRLESLTLDLQGDGPVPTLQARGRLQPSPWQLAAEGELPRWPAAWPALPLPLRDVDAPIAFDVTQAGERAMAAEATVELRQADALLSVRGHPDALFAWQDAPADTLPPLTGEARVPALTIESVRLEGIELRVVDDDENPSP